MIQPPLLTVLDGEFAWPEWTDYPVERFSRSERWSLCTRCGRRTRGRRTIADEGQIVATFMCPSCWLRYEEYEIVVAPSGVG